MAALVIIISVFAVVIFAGLAIQFGVNWYISRTPSTDTIMCMSLDAVYMKRWILWPRSLDTRKSTYDGKDKFVLAINRFYGPDLDPPHNHMGWSISLSVDGIGIERIEGHPEGKFILPFSIRFRSNSERHQIDGCDFAPLTTIFLMRLDKNHKWGFWEDGKFIEAKNFKGRKAFKQ